MHSRERAKAIAVLPQILEKPHVTVEEFVMFGRTPYLNFYQKPSEEDVQAVQQAMKDAGVEGLRNKMVDCLSGGERQKAYIAMILAQQTKLIILDEPTTYMDMENETAFLNLLTKLKKNHKKTLLVIMHNLAQAVRYADHILVLDKQRIVFDGTKEECLQSDILEQVFHVKKHIFMEEGTRYVFFDA